jgi:hypothetical protein
MVGDRPVVGVRNPVCFTFISIFLRAKNAGASSPDSGEADPGKPHPGNKNQTVSPVPLLEAALHYGFQ